MNKQRLYHNTPLLHSLPLSERAQVPVWIKLDALQPCGSFKARGIGHACCHHAERGCRRFVSSSGGNAGLAVAYSGRMLQIPVTVVVPVLTGERAKQLICAEGASVIVHGASWQEAHTHALSLVTDQCRYIHPFDDPLIWEGHASLIDEVVAAGLTPDQVVLSVGGGGLFCGVVQGLEKNKVRAVRIVTAETTGTQSFFQSIKKGTPIELERIEGVALTLGAKRVALEALSLAQQRDVAPQLVSDREAVEAALTFADDHRVVVEPACGASLALLYKHPEIFRGARAVLVIVCGGVASTYASLLEMQKTAGV